MKTFTLAELADAIEKNGLEQTTGYFFNFGPNIALNYIDSVIVGKEKITKACALGQAAINLGVMRPGGWKWVNTGTEYYISIDNLCSDLIRFNDRGHSFKEVADFIRMEYANMLEWVIEALEYDYSPYLEK